MKNFYVFMCVIGTVFPLSIFATWLVEHGFDMNLLCSEILNSKIGAFAWADVLVSAVVLIGFIVVEGKRQSMTNLWLPIVATCCVGVSLGLPLFLYMREKSLDV